MGQNKVGYTEAINFRCLEDLEKTYSMDIMNPLKLCYCGREDCTPGWRFGPYTRTNYVIHVVVNGRGKYYVGKNEFQIQAGDAFLIYPDIETVYEADKEDPWSYMWIGFNGYRAESICENIGFTREQPVVKLRRTELVSATLDRIFEARELTTVNEMKRMAAFYDVLALLMQENYKESVHQNPSDVTYVKMAVDIIISSYNHKIKIADIADQIGINRSYLTNIFKREMSMSPQTFLINFRLEKAAQLLRETEEPIGNIAISVGYTDALSFSKAFRQKYHITPSAYRTEKPELYKSELRGGYVGSYQL